MKTVKKDHWTYKLLLYTYEWLPTNTCKYYAALALAIIVSPIIGYVTFAEYTFSGKINRPTAKNKKGEEVLGIIVLATLTTASFFCLSGILSVFLIGLMSLLFPQLSVILGNNMFYTFILSASIGLVVYPLIIMFLIPLYKKAKKNLCREVVYEENSQSQ